MPSGKTTLLSSLYLQRHTMSGKSILLSSLYLQRHPMSGKSILLSSLYLQRHTMSGKSILLSGLYLQRHTMSGKSTLLSSLYLQRHIMSGKLLLSNCFCEDIQYRGKPQSCVLPLAHVTFKTQRKTLLRVATSGQAGYYGYLCTRLPTSLLGQALVNKQPRFSIIQEVRRHAVIKTMSFYNTCLFLFPLHLSFPSSPREGRKENTGGIERGGR